MGIHWYARSPEGIAIANALDEVESRIFSPGADEVAIDAAVEEREVLFARQETARSDMEARARTVPLASARDWPDPVARHVEALGPGDPTRSFLDFLAWGPDYYAENLRSARVPIDAFSRPLLRLDLSPDEARDLAEELLRYADGPAAHVATRARAARVAGLWLWFWGSLGCRVRAGD